ncbi:enoyl-CoA hydratase [Ureibacillus chungkukjangi]|uniref:Enoyl-CoA hydratase/carnithine racemase n=1 Tax=Ureibacillus chungkukjangi TaxID=1202712 RepID=A0A318TMX7_9BACL|nr:enoyl-CoA hydratase [Ureibacillus chungkukjangi]PYF05974.1 enoyl-CoA hydratase/carnithine racemase [Ureibacillus chungkukjangi]
MTKFVKVEVQDGVALIMFTRAEAANSLSIQLLHEINETLEAIHYDRSIRAVIVTGDGDKAFCAGADLKERKGMNEEETRKTIALIGRTVNHFEAIAQPVIAAINGVAFGGGLELALACDIRMASSTAKLGLTETALGIIPGAGGTQRLPRLIGIGKAKELIYTARRLSAEEAYRYGIIEYIVEPQDLLKQAKELALEIGKNAPLSLVQAKTAINQGMQTDISTGLQIESLAYSRLLHTEDRLEGLKAFQEKRSPVYRGK